MIFSENVIFRAMKFRIITILLVLGIYGTLHSDIIMQPYLMSVSKNSVFVLIETNNSDTVTVQYGTSPSYGISSKSMSISVTPAFTYVHKVYVTGLSPATQYFYRAVQGVSVSAGYSFRTAVNAGTPFKFEWYADFRTGIDVHSQISQRMSAHNPLFILNGGDVCEFQTYESWKNEFFIPADLNNMSNIPFYYTPGNHEGWNDLTKAFVINPNSSSGTQDYYSFDYGDYHFLSINNYVDYSVNSPQYNFIQNDLSTTTKPWKIVMCHQPPYCAGGHGNDSAMIRIAENLFVPNNVDVVFSGHSHFYQHNLVSNIRYMVIGCAGAPLYEPDTASFVIKSVKDYCYGVIETTPNSFYLKVYNNLDTLLDSLRITKPHIGINNEVTTINDYQLFQNYPNPFNPKTKIVFDLKKSDKVRLCVYDINGREISVLANRYFTPGKQEVVWNAAEYSSGIYFYTFETSNYRETRKMILLK